ncbi:GTP-binding protein [Gordonia sp. HNM0687]|uniref:GTP-binding protein n=1 Tax=Gordonia mangrovi TaxID=2665643 RepID=A0A6L7GQ35_9ACTN|nr:GTP-binding protein [Gordonia mangrovi]MXP20765.1 GTP-binding protein [Gordonia mangrovi]UVF78665.1 GTP-binding protein [Gordonia mangrovi]
MTRPTVPVIVVAGFLGSGKTTLLNHLLRNAAGARIGVLVNDFGSINIDAMLIAGQAESTVSLSNGCMCCAVDADGAQDALVRLLRPKAAIDAIVIEASGIAEPRALVRMVTAFDDPRMRYGGLVYLVDAATGSQLRVRHPEIDRHVEIADLVVVNKADLAGEDELARVRADVRAVNDTAPLVVTADGVIDPAALFDVVPRADEVGGTRSRQLTLDELLEECAHESGDHGPGDHDRADRRHDHLHDGFTSVDFVSDRPLNPRRLAEFLERPPAGCYRIKGVVAFDVPGHRQRFVVHAVGGFVRVQREPWGGRLRTSTLVAIGVGMDADIVDRRLAELVDDGEPDPNGVLSITRYLVTAP